MHPMDVDSPGIGARKHASLGIRDHAGRASSIGVTNVNMSKAAAAGRAMILPLALAQFIASYAATNMNVAISSIAADLGTDVAGVQTAITLFTFSS